MSPAKIAHEGEIPGGGLGDSDRAMELLSEYSQKLRLVCKDHLQQKSVRLLSIFVAMALVVLVMAVAYLIISGIFEIRTEAKPSILILCVLIAAMFPVFVVFYFRGGMYQYDADHLALIVERLISTASQYSEHAASSLSRKFEFDLRLAEADASLKMYRSVFNSHGGRSFSVLLEDPVSNGGVSYDSMKIMKAARDSLEAFEKGKARRYP